MITAAEIVQNPSWYLHAINLDEPSLLFVKTDPKALSACSFLDHRFETQALPTASIALDDLLTFSESIETAPPRFIFHTAFCCSTLLARCLDVESANVSLKEPAVLMALANYQRTGHQLLADAVQARAIYTLVLRLLFRNFGKGQSVIVKPTNTVNNIIEPLMATHPESKALLLHSDLESFLISTLKKGEQGRGFARHLFTIFRMDSAEAQQLDMTQLMRMTDSQIAAITWHLQLESFIDVLQQFDQARVKSLHCDRLLSDPESVLSRVVGFFDSAALEKNFDHLIDRAPLHQNAKTPDQNYDANDRSKEYARAQDRFSESLKVILPWAKQLRFKHAYSDKIAHPL